MKKQETAGLSDTSPEMVPLAGSFNYYCSCIGGRAEEGLMMRIVHRKPLRR